MNEVSITIVATVRNEVGTIAAFVDSLLAQTHTPDHIIIVDGESSDGTLQILQDYESRGQIRVISTPCNIAQGRNLGIAAATTSHLAITDAGCKVTPDWLEHIFRCFGASPSPDVVAGNFRFEVHSAFENAVVLATFQPGRDESETAQYYPSSRSVAFSKAAWERAGGYPEWLYAAEDTLFNIRLRQVGCRFVFCKEAIVLWRPRETWRALAKQRINFSRGNARVGIGTAGYLKNLYIHAAVLLLLAGVVAHPLLPLAGLAVFAWHVRAHLWPQASAASRDWGTRLRVLAVMEFVRVVNLYGFIQGRWDRIRDSKTYVDSQIRYMGSASADQLQI